MLDPKMKASDMDLRSYFAAMAMNGFVSNPGNHLKFNPKDDAEYCLKLADALIKELSRNEPFE